jgi:glycosyltransferase involved in cell wall biosynthesis
MGDGTPWISLCMIVRNERPRLGAALESVRGLADELIVVDTGSTDGTQDLARQMGASVVEAPWSGDFSAARNVGLDRARGPWILVLDADETLSSGACAEVRALVQPAPRAAFTLIQVGLDPYGRPMRMPITRLFPNDPGVRFEFPLHEQVDRALARRGIPVRLTAIEIRHSGYDSPPRAAEKRLQYRGIIEAALSQGPGEETALHLWYLKAVNHFENTEWRQAAEAFANCIAQAPSSTANVVLFSRIRAAECLLQIGDWRAALAYLPERPGPEVHPAALYFRARIATVQGDPDGARPWYEAILSAPPGPWQPEVNLAMLKQRAAAALAAVPPPS